MALFWASVAIAEAAVVLVWLLLRRTKIRPINFVTEVVCLQCETTQCSHRRRE